MKLPFVLRADHDEMVRMLKEDNQRLRSELHALEDLIWQRNLGFQIHGTRPELVEPEPEPVPELAPAQRAEEEEANRQRDVRAQLRSRMRTRPSTVGPFLERQMKDGAVRAARAANPGVAQIFEKAKEQVLSK